MWCEGTMAIEGNGLIIKKVQGGFPREVRTWGNQIQLEHI